MVLHNFPYACYSCRPPQIFDNSSLKDKQFFFSKMTNEKAYSYEQTYLTSLAIPVGRIIVNDISFKYTGTPFVPKG